MTNPDRTDLSGPKATGPLDRTETPYAHNDLTPSLKAEVERLTEELAATQEQADETTHWFRNHEAALSEIATLTAERDALKERAEQRYERLERLNEDYVALRAQLAAKSSDNERLRKALEEMALKARLAAAMCTSPGVIAGFLELADEAGIALNPNTKEGA